MIRPVTCICFVLACGSGLYLYQSKHRVQVLDREIEKTVHTTDALREQVRVLHAEWTLLNDPQRLQALADQFLALKTVAPGQFTSMADLDNRLPAVRAPEPPPPEPQSVPVAEAPVAAQTDEPPSVPAPAAIQTPPKPTSVAVATPPRVPEHKPSPVRTQQAEVPPARPTPAVSRSVVAVEQTRPATARIMSAVVPAPQAPTPFVGSALGMAHSGTVAPPQPMPVSASQWVTNGGGGG
jgi:hypothetical protein